MIARDPIVRRSKPSRRAAAAPRVARPAPQASYYSSLGRSVERQANRQRARPAPRPAAPRPTRRTSFSGPRGDVQTGGPRQLERAQAYRTSRPYYRTYRQVWKASPGPQRALSQIRRGSAEKKQALAIKAKQPRRSEDLYGVGTRRQIAGLVLNDRLLRKGPDILSTEAYNKYADKLWKRAKRYYPSGKQPGLKVGYKDPEGSFALAWVKPKDRNVVHVQPEIPRVFMSPKRYRGQSESVLLHEWAHTRQSPRTLRNQPKREGGAQALDRLLAGKLHVRFQDTTDPEYRRWARKARRKGRRYLLHGQFR